MDKKITDISQEFLLIKDTEHNSYVLDNCSIEVITVDLNTKYNLRIENSSINQIIFKDRNPRNLKTNSEKIRFSKTDIIKTVIDCDLKTYNSNKKNIDQHCNKGRVNITHDVILNTDGYGINPRFVIKVIGQDLNIVIKKSLIQRFISIESEHRNNFTFEDTSLYFTGDCSSFKGEIYKLLLETGNFSLPEKYYNRLNYLELRDQIIEPKWLNLSCVKDLVINSCVIDNVKTHARSVTINNSVVKNLSLLNKEVENLNIDSVSFSNIESIDNYIIIESNLPSVSSNDKILDFIKFYKIKYLEKNNLSKNL